jgi:hypothetical protein
MLELLNHFQEKFNADSISERFEFTKKFSDYVGMVTRIIFLGVAISLFGKYIDSHKSEYGFMFIFYLHFFYYILIGFSLLFYVLFATMTMHAVDKFFRFSAFEPSARWKKVVGTLALGLLVAPVYVVVSSSIGISMYAFFSALLEKANLPK